MYLFVQKLMYSCKYQTILKDIEQWEKEDCEMVQKGSLRGVISPKHLTLANRG